MTKFCKNCGNKLIENANVCDQCGAVVNLNSTVTHVSSNVDTNVFAITGFIVSIVSLFCFGVTSSISLIFSILGLVNSKNTKGNGKGMSIAGIVISVVGMLIVIGFMIFSIIMSIKEGTTPTTNYYYGSRL